MEQGANQFKLTIPLGTISYTYDLYFLLALALAIVVVFLFSMQKFGQPVAEKTDDDFITPLLPKYLTTPEEYSRALIGYVTTMIVIVVMLSILGPRVVSLGSTTVPDAPNALPLFVALVLVGILPNVPWLQELELHLRRFAHERAFIPRAARAMAERLAAADFEFSRYNSDDVLRSPGMRGVQKSDFKAARGKLEYSWARLSCLLYQLRQRQDAGLILPLDGEVLQRYSKDLENLALKRKLLEGDVARYRAEKATDPYYSDDQLQRAVATLMRQLYTLLGCAVRLKLSSDFIGDFGFILNSDKAVKSNKNLMIVGLAVMAVGIFLTVYAAILLQWLVQWYAPTAPIWRPSADFPKQEFQPFVWTISSVLAHGAAIAAANWLRRRRKASGKWFGGMAADHQRVAANYIYVALLCGVVGFCVNFLWGIIFVDPSLLLARFVSPTVILPMATGTFYVFHLDNCELSKRPSRFVEIGLQALVTGFCGFIAARASRELLGMQPSNDVAILTAVVGCVIGGSLAWYVPNAAATDRDPVADEVNSRIGILRSEAIRCFGSNELADRWIDQPNSNLNNRSPKQGSGDIATFERALSLLCAQTAAPPSTPESGAH